MLGLDAITRAVLSRRTARPTQVCRRSALSNQPGAQRRPGQLTPARLPGSLVSSRRTNRRRRVSNSSNQHHCELAFEGRRSGNCRCSICVILYNHNFRKVLVDSTLPASFGERRGSTSRVSTPKAEISSPGKTSN